MRTFSAKAGSGPPTSEATKIARTANRRGKHDRVNKDAPLPSTPEADKSPFRCGSVALVGRPNVGKSTLLNRLVGSKVAIVSDKPQTTRSRILGIQTTAKAQILWLDAPGMHGHRRVRTLLNERMLRTAEDVLEEADVAILVLDATAGFGPSDAAIQHRVAASKRPWLIVVTQIDRVPRGALLRLVADISERFPGVDVVPVSGRTGGNAQTLVRAVSALLPEGPPLHPADELTDQSARRLVEEYVREKIFEETSAEIPYRAAVQVELFEEGRGRLDVVHAVILVEREGHKRILVGRGGRMIRTIGTKARLDLERMLRRRLHLELFVKVREDWSDDARMLGELGF